MTLIDGRPPGLDAFYRPANGVTKVLTWPEGSLAGRTFVATLDGVALDVDVDLTGTVMTLSCDAAQASAVTGPADFVLTEVLADGDLDTLVGTWKPSNNPAAVERTSERTIVVDSHEVTVQPAASPASTPTGVIDEAVLASATEQFDVGAFTVNVRVPGTIVTVPDVPYATLLRGRAPMIHTVADAMCGLAIVPEGADVGDRLDISYGYNGSPASNPATGYPEALIDPHSPGTYQLLLYSFTTGKLRIDAGPGQKAWLRVFPA